MLDRETTERFTFDVLAIDQGEPRLNSSATVVIDVNDVQDSDPVFEHKIYNFTVNENSNFEVGRVVANLADKDFKHLLVYAIAKVSGLLYLEKLLLSSRGSPTSTKES